MNIAQILPFLDLSIFYQAFKKNLPFSWCGIYVAGGVCASLRHHTSIRINAVSPTSFNSCSSIMTDCL